MMHKRLLLYTVLIPLATMVFTACNKDDEDEMETQTTTASEDQAIAQAAWDDAGNQADNSSQSEEVEGMTASRDLWQGCASISVTTLGNPFPLEVTLDFGETNCTGNDGRQRRGKINYRMTDRYRNPGCTISVMTDGYFVNDYGVAGERTIINLGENNAGQSHYSIEVAGAVVTKPNGDQISWNSNRTRTWVEGEDTGFLTPDGNGGFLGIDGILDDVYEITGSADGTDRNGLAYDLQITTALRAQLDCSYITSGELELTPEGLRTRIINYGDGTCDDQAEVTVGNWQGSITLR